MKVRKPKQRAITKILALMLTGFMLSLPVVHACTRLVYLGDNQDVITARSMDWKTDVATNLWVFPNGMRRSGEVGQNSIKWVSKYGSVVASGYDIATTDGVNEAGLAANLLWLAESEYLSLA
ncbi:choloylglycine hydrolase [Pseudomonas chlororaphis]|nr:Choloylglycine hydrolase [Pseudomonas chlororaphis subsp. aurantiaca]SUD55252.1 choloylglycine hydrolase [Pseudomonas chlororaphis]